MCVSITSDVVRLLHLRHCRDAKCKPATLVTLQAFAIKNLFIIAPSRCNEKHSNDLLCLT